MSPPVPPEESAAEGQLSVPTPFLSKAYQLVDDSALDDVISWNVDGSTFVVWRPEELARDLLPIYFKHNNFSSFVRQLNTYGFRKVVTDRWEFANNSFRRGKRRLIGDIHRRKFVHAAVPIPASSGDDQVMSSHSSPPAEDLVGENERLRKENLHLTREHARMRSLCNNIVLLMSNFSTGNGSERPRVFGVAIGSKSGRELDDPQMPVVSVSEMKSEPVDSGSDSSRWLLQMPQPDQNVCTGKV